MMINKMNNIAATLFLGFWCITIHAQEAPAILKSMMESKSRLIKRGDLTVKHKEFFLKDTTVSDQGYFLIVGMPDYHRVISDTIKIDSFEQSHESIPVTIKSQNYKLIGKFVESENRRNIVYRADNRNIMITVWNYKNDGANLTLAEEMFNIDINKHPGTLSLVVSDGNDAMWKLTWKESNTLFEVYVEDWVSKATKPSLSPSQVLEKVLVVLTLNDSTKP